MEWRTEGRKKERKEGRNESVTLRREGWRSGRESSISSEKKEGGPAGLSEGKEGRTWGCMNETAALREGRNEGCQDLGQGRKKGIKSTNEEKEKGKNAKRKVGGMYFGRRKEGKRVGFKVGRIESKWGKGRKIVGRKTNAKENKMKTCKRVLLFFDPRCVCQILLLFFYFYF